MSQRSTAPKHHHEEIEVESKQAERTLLVRPERYSIGNWDTKLYIANQSFEVLNFSAFGIAVISPHTLSDLMESQIEASFVIEKSVLQQVKLELKYENSISASKFKTVFEIIGEPLDVHRVAGVYDSLSVTKSFIERSTEENSFLPEFRRLVLETKDFLMELRHQINGIDATWRNLPPQALAQRQEGVVATITHFLKMAMPEKLSELTQILGSVPPSDRLRYYDYFRNRLKELLYDAPIADRAYNKPLGYAGDYEMMNLIYRDTYEGRSLFSKALHKFYIDQAAAQAVKNRGDYLGSKIMDTIKKYRKTGQPVEVLSVASGPAMELQKLFSKWNNHSDEAVNFSLIDQDLEALQHAQHKLREISLTRDLPDTLHVEYMHTAIKNIIGRGIPSQKQYHLIYSAGLFDYLSDAVAVACMQKLFKSLAPGGTLVIGNFNVENPTRPVMEVVLDWHLIHRTEADMLALGKAVCQDSRIEFESERINLFLTMSKG